MNEKQQQLTFEKGITCVPSDAICSDNALRQCTGMTYNDGEMRPIQKPKQIEGIAIPTGGAFVYVHRTNKSTRYIYTIEEHGEKKVKWTDGVIQVHPEIFQYSGDISISSVGNILVVSDENRIQYAQWNGTEYLYLGNGVPDLSITPFLGIINDDGDDDVEVKVQRVELGPSYGVRTYRVYKYNTGDMLLPYSYRIGPKNEYDGNLLYHQFCRSTDVEKEKAFQNLITGIVEEAIENTHKKGGFLFPFWFRYAWELYDGSVVNVSNPILMFPNVREGMYVAEKFDKAHETIYPTFIPEFTPKFLKLNIGYNADLEKYKDLIRSVKIYISDFVRTHEFNDDEWEIQCPGTTINPIWDDGEFFVAIPIGKYSKIKKNEKLTLDDGVYKLGISNLNNQRLQDNNPESDPDWGYSLPESDPLSSQSDDPEISIFYKSYIKAPRKDDNDIKKELLEKSVFYEILEIPFEELLDGNLTYVDVKERLEKDTLNNLTTLTQLPHDDFFSHSQIFDGKLFTYNNRLNVFDFHRRAFEGYDLFAVNNMVMSPIYKSWSHFKFEVHIKSDDGELIVQHDSGTAWVQGRWFFYPDSRATRVVIYVEESGVWKILYNLLLKEHPYLNGAYYFGALPDIVAEEIEYDLNEWVVQENYYPKNLPIAGDIPSPVTDEYLPNTIMTSEVDNPIAFYAEGTNKFGEGTILGLATQTVALSNGTEFGRQPLILFTDRGLWSMTVSSTGLYDSINPLPREVCNNPKSITEVDGAVFFSSNKGLMVIVGSDVKCVSGQLSDKGGSPFVNYLKDSQIAYDYRDSLLWIFSDTNLIWIYNIKSGTFSQFDCTGVRLSKTVPDYPDYLFQSGQNIYTLIGRPSADDDDKDYTAMFKTRPMKLENALALKSIMQIRHIHQLSSDAMREFSLEIRASNDLRNWHTLTSLRGIPWKYYTFKYNFGVLYATDSFAGTVLITQERRTNKLR